MYVIYALLVGGVLVTGCSTINKQIGLPDDHFVEEAVEHQIEQHTGQDIDLTPSSKE